MASSELTANPAKFAFCRKIVYTVKMVLTEEERTLFAPLEAVANERVYRHAVESITQLAGTLGVGAADFLPPSRGSTKAFEGLDVDYFGPIKTERGMVVRRSLFDTVTKQGYFTNTAAGLLRFGIDADGNIYGNVGVLRELLQGNLTIEGDGRNFGINSILSSANF